MAFSFVFSAEDAILLVVLVGYATWWAYDLRRGSKLSRPSLTLHIVVYGLLAGWVWLDAVGLLSVAQLLRSGFVVLWVLLLPVLFVAGAIHGLRFARRRLVMQRLQSGRWLYRGAAAVPLVWLGLWLVRLGLEDGFLQGYSVFSALFLRTGLPNGVSNLQFGVIVLVITSLYLLSFGLMAGFSLAAWGNYRRARRELPAARAVPPTRMD